MSYSQTTHLEEEFKDYKKLYPSEWVHYTKYLPGWLCRPVFRAGKQMLVDESLSDGQLEYSSHGVLGCA